MTDLSRSCPRAQPHDLRPFSPRSPVLGHRNATEAHAKQATTIPSTTRERSSSPLDDPVDFAHGLYSKLWNGFGSAEITVNAGIEAALEPFEQTKDQIVALLAEHPEAPAIRRHLDRLGELCITISQDQRDLGAELGIASNQRRRILRAGMTGPRQRSWVNE